MMLRTERRVKKGMNLMFAKNIKHLKRRFVSCVLAVLMASTSATVAVSANETKDTGMRTPLIITEVTPDTDNVNSSDAYEFFEIYNTSDKTLSMDDFTVRYNNTDIWTPDQSGLKIEPGETLVFWILNGKNSELTADDFNAYYGTSFVLGENLATIHSDGFHNSKERVLELLTKTGTQLASVKYNDNDVKLVELNNGITFAYDESGIEETRLGYSTKATPGEISEEQKPDVSYSFSENFSVTVSASNVQEFNKAWQAEVVSENNEAVFSAELFVKADGWEEYKSYDVKYQDSKLVGEVPYTDVNGCASFSWYVQCSNGIETVKTDEKTVKVLDGEIDKSTIPVLTVTEILPDSSNVDGADAYEFIEIYNNSNENVNLKDYILYYNYPDNGDESDVQWASFDKDTIIKSGECAVLWVKNGKNDSLTADDFNQKFGTDLKENENLFCIESGGMANSGARALRLTSAVHDELDFVAYNMNGEDNTNADKTITFKYDIYSGESVMTADDAVPTPGTVTDDQKPEMAEVKVPENEPSYTDLTPDTFTDEEALTFAVEAKSEETTIKSVSLYYHDNTTENFERYNLFRTEGDKFTQTLESIDLTAKIYFEYYFVISDGFNTVTTPVAKTASTSVSQESLKFNVEDGEYISGTKQVITTGTKITVDGEDVTSLAYPSIENNAKFVFEVSQTDTFFKNAVAIGNDVLGIFNEGTYENWQTIVYDVDPQYFTKGETIQIDIHAGNKANALEHNEENNDDFVVKNIRLILPDGKTLRAAGFEEPAKVISMGDSSGKIEILNAVFTVDDSSFNSLAYDFDTKSTEDGEHTVTAELNGETKTVKVNVDNTAPQVDCNIEDGKTYKGRFTISADITDAGSGIAASTVKLDGEAVELPMDINGVDMEAGEHKLQFNVTDKCSNTTDKTITFIIPEENPDISDGKPENGSETDADPVLSVKVDDPTGDDMNVVFKQGKLYSLGDSNITVSEGISDTAGTSENVFEENTGNGFPYQQFEIALPNGIEADENIRISWSGETNNNATYLYVYNTDTNSWDKTDAELITENGTSTLEATIPAAAHVSDNIVKVMVQNGEGYTPTQYAEGEPAIPSDNENITTSNPDDLDRSLYDFTFAIESDTQYYNEDTPDNPGAIGQYQYQNDIHDWLIANRSRMNIQYLFHDGDIIDDEPIDSEWINADNAYKKLDETNFPYGILAGNHDVGHLSGDYSKFYQYFGEDRYSSNPWYGGSYKDNRGHYDLITVDGIDFIMIFTGWGIGDEEIKWMNDVLAQYPDRIAILNFHEYLLASGGLGEEPQRVYDEVVSVNPNVRMVLSGHYHNAKTVVSQFDDDGDGVNDRNVYQMLFDYQGLSEGGMGYIRLMHFDCEGEKIIIKTYSPSLDDYNAKDYPGIGGQGIVGEENFEISFADLGITPETKTVSTSGFTAEVLTNDVIGTVENVKSGETASVVWENAPEGRNGWYAEVTDQFGGITRSKVSYVTVGNEKLLGDLNNDGKVTVMDATIIQLHLLGSDKYGDLDTAIADVNNDGIVNIDDASKIQRISAKME